MLSVKNLFSKNNPKISETPENNNCSISSKKMLENWRDNYEYTNKEEFLIELNLTLKKELASATTIDQIKELLKPWESDYLRAMRELDATGGFHMYCKTSDWKIFVEDVFESIKVGFDKWDLISSHQLNNPWGRTKEIIINCRFGSELFMKILYDLGRFFSKSDFIEVQKYIMNFKHGMPYSLIECEDESDYYQKVLSIINEIDK